MKRFLVLLLLVSSMAQAQILEPVTWETSVKKISETEYELVFKAAIDEGFHLYSVSPRKNGPKATTFIFEDSEDFEIVGGIKEGAGKTEFEKMFNMEVTYFELSAVFKQRIKLKPNNKAKIIGEIDFMSCDNRYCVLGYEDFEFNLN